MAIIGIKKPLKTRNCYAVKLYKIVIPYKNVTITIRQFPDKTKTCHLAWF